MSTRISRRALLRGTLGGGVVTVALPRLEAMLNGNGTAWAAGGALPVRFGVWGWSNGVHLRRWVPATTGTGWAMTEQLMPLAAQRDYFSVVSGMETKYGVGKGHCQNPCNLLTGMKIRGRDTAGFGVNGETASGPSIDQIVAKQAGSGTRLPSIELGVDNGMPQERNTASRYFSHSGPFSANIPIYNTRQAFDRLFPTMNAPVGGGTLDATAALRKRLLDVVRQDAAGLRMRLGAKDRMRLDQHLEGIDSLEKQIQALGPNACLGPKAPEALEHTPRAIGASTQANLDPMGPTINRIMSELLASALACDVTRVFTFQYSPPGTRVIHPGIGVDSSYHELTHENTQQPKVNAMVKFYMSELAVFMDVLRKTPDGAGNLLDNCAVLATTDCAEGLSHSPSDFPMLVLGRGGGKLRPGVHYRSTTREVATKVPFTLARVAGATLTSFGDEAQLANQEVSAILA
jgi:hypothetical protein